MSVTTFEAKYDGDKHSSVSPVPFQTTDFVEYLRSDEVVFKPTTPLESLFLIKLFHNFII